MNFEPSQKVKDLQEQLWDFMNTHILPNEKALEDEVARNRKNGNPWVALELMEQLKQKAKDQGLWNLFLPHEQGAGLTNLEYAPLCEIMGYSHYAAEVFNCSAPDTGNMEVLSQYGTDAQKDQWLSPLLDGKIRSAFAMTEPAVGSSDATNIESEIKPEGDYYVINGTKWWTSGAMDPRCEILIFMGKTNPEAPRHKQQSMILVPLKTAGVTIERHLPVFGYDHAPHGHALIHFKDVKVPKENILLGEGRGFEIAQGRLGPGRIHHCMRCIGQAERALKSLCKRALNRHVFGKKLSDQGVTRERIAEARIMIDQARLLVLNAADKMDKHGNKAARKEIAMIKVAAPHMLCQVIDWAIQMHGAAGVTSDFDLAASYAAARTLKIADGPDEVHRDQIARMELETQKKPAP